MVQGFCSAQKQGLCFCVSGIISQNILCYKTAAEFFSDFGQNKINCDFIYSPKPVFIYIKIY
jgi:hypothetical protein